MLERQGHVVHVEHDGESGLRAAEQLRPEVALVDIGLPGMDGYELARRVRELYAVAPLLLAAITGYGPSADRVRAEEAGFDHHLVKPFDLKRLEGLLRVGV